jgi:hypothetical protein
MWSSLVLGWVDRDVRNLQHPLWQVAQQPADVSTGGGTFVGAAVGHLAHSRNPDIGVAGHISDGGYTINATPTPLRDVENAWNRSSRSAERIVFLP